MTYESADNKEALLVFSVALKFLLIAQKTCKWIKQHLRMKTFYGTDRNAGNTQNV